MGKGFPLQRVSTGHYLPLIHTLYPNNSKNHLQGIVETAHMPGIVSCCCFLGNMLLLLLVVFHYHFLSIRHHAEKLLKDIFSYYHSLVVVKIYKKVFFLLLKTPVSYMQKNLLPLS